MSSCGCSAATMPRRAAYNAGPGAVKNAMARGGKNWLAQMPRETQSLCAEDHGRRGRLPPSPTPLPKCRAAGSIIFSRTVGPHDQGRTIRLKDSLRLGIETGQVSIGDILSAPVDDGDKNTLQPLQGR